MTSKENKFGKQSEEGGTLFEYRYDADNNSWILEYIVGGIPKKGTEVLKKFVRKIGKGQNVIAEEIIEPETRKKLKELSMLAKVHDTGESITIEDKDILKKLKIVRFLERSGIKVDKLTLNKIEGEIAYPELMPDEYYVTLDVYGRT